MVPGRTIRAVTGDDDLDANPFPAGLPSRGAYLLAFVSVVLAGLFGGIIGYGLVDVGCTGNCNTSKVVGTLAGALTGAIGVGIVAVLVLRAMAEWKRRPRG